MQNFMAIYGDEMDEYLEMEDHHHVGHIGGHHDLRENIILKDRRSEKVLTLTFFDHHYYERRLSEKEFAVLIIIA